jgi:ArsR family transcriptional regulator
MKGLKALANPTRLRILHLLKDPPVFTGSGAGAGRKGVTGMELLKHLHIRQPSLTEQMQILEDVGLIETRKSGRWVLYTRDEERIRQLKQTIIDELLP